jgi:hypothetical protein
MGMYPGGFFCVLVFIDGDVSLVASSNYVLQPHLININKPKTLVCNKIRHVVVPHSCEQKATRQQINAGSVNLWEMLQCWREM